MAPRIPVEQHDPFLDVTATVIIAPAARGFRVQPTSPEDPAVAEWAAPLRGRRFRTAQDAALAVSAEAIQRAMPEETSRRPRQTPVTEPQRQQERERDNAQAAATEFGFSDDLRERDSRQHEAQRQRS